MPMYEYGCRKCLRRFEKIERFSDEPQTVCAECGGQIDRLLSAPAVRFKGTGWYVTDYGSKSGAPSPSAPGGNGAQKSGEKGSEKSAAAPASSSGSSSTESTPSTSKSASSNTSSKP